MNQIIKHLNQIRPEANFLVSDDYISDGLLDSFDVVSLVSELDEKYNISIDGVDVIPDNFKNANAIAKLLKKNGIIL